MVHYGNGNLEDMFGREVVDKLTNVYGDILGSIIQQRSYDAVPRHLRLTIAHALICEAERGETDSTYLKDAALVALARYDEGAIANAA